jgi:hypothetical protein
LQRNALNALQREYLADKMTQAKSRAGASSNVAKKKSAPAASEPKAPETTPESTALVKRSNASSALAQAWSNFVIFRLVVVVSGTALIVELLRVILTRIVTEREQIWAANTIDSVVLLIFTLVAAATLLWIVFYLVKPDSGLLHGLRREFAAWVATAVLVLTLFVGYASFRNQSRLSAEAALEEAGYDLYGIEMNEPKLRCLYFNYGHHDPNPCLERIVSDPDLWSLAIFYVEESWFQLEQANKERKEWGATYAEQIKYWAEDVGRDPTGLFAYYLLSSEDSMDDVFATMEAAGVQIENPCENYRRVWDALARRGKHPRIVKGAALRCGLMAPAKMKIEAAVEGSAQKRN